MKLLFQILIIFLLIPLQAGFSQETASLSPTSLDERNLRDGDGDTLIITLEGATFNDPIGAITRFNLSNYISGKLIRDKVERIDDNNVRLILTLSGNIDANVAGITVEVERETTSHNQDITTDNSFTVNSYDEPDATLSGNSVFCGSGGSTSLTIDFSGQRPFTYNYEKDGTAVGEITVDAMSDIIVADEKVTYNLTYVIDKNGIRTDISGESITVIQEEYPAVPSISGEFNPCSYTQESYTASGGSGSFRWTVSGGSINGADNLSSVTIDWNSGAASITVTESTAGGCATPETETVTLKASPPKPAVTGDVGFCQDSVATLEAPPGYAAYYWNTTEITQTITVSNDNNYQVRVQNANGCWSLNSDNYSVTAYTTPRGWISINKDEICEGEIALLKISVNNYNSNWDAVYYDGTANQSVTNISTGFTNISVNPPAGYQTYTLINVNDGNCPGEVISFLDEANITVNASPEIVFTQSRDQFPTTEDPYTFEATPAGGTFSCSASGAISSDGIFSPDKADTCDCNIVTYTVTDGSTGCTSNKSITVEVYVPKGDFVAPGSYDNGTYKYIYCFDAPSDIISIENLYIPTGHMLIGSAWIGTVIPDGSDPLKATFNPSTAGDGFHTISFIYITQQLVFPFIIYMNQLPPELFVVDFVGSQTIDGLLDKYCLNADSVELKVTGFINTLNPGGSSGVPLFEGPGVSSNGAGEFWFNPDRAGSGNKTVTYSFTRDFSQCAITDQQLEVIHPLPRLGFDVPDVCVFTDPSIPDSTQFVNTSIDFVNIVTWSWDFGDPTSGVDNISNLANPYHDYNSDGSKTILLSGTDINNCTDVYTPNPAITLGRRSVATFTWENECDVDTLNLFAEDDGLVTEFHWDFGDGTTYPDLVTQFPKHHFPGAANYELGLIVKNSFNCFDSIKHIVPIRTTYTIRSDSVPYFEDFDNFLTTSKADWVSGPYGGTSINNWDRALLEGSVINDPIFDSAWVTNPSGPYFDGEQSLVEGPCFDFAEVKKPMIKFNYWVHAETGKDGVVLQSSVDDGKNWDVVGSNEDGINWYNSALIFGQPGGQRLGWTGITQTGWKEARNLLDPIIGSRVRFRFVLGANPDASNYDGFAFDNIWIGERSRIVLLEHFTNENSLESEDADTTVNRITLKNKDEVIDIQYHTSFPGQDSRNLYYPAGPSARSLYYGITSVPYSIMDGQSDFFGFDGPNGEYSWDEGDLLKRVLVDPLMEIDLSSSEVSNNRLNVISKLHLLDGNLKSENLTLHLAVVENETDKVIKVLKKMIPHTGGTSLFYLWTADDSVSVNYSWDFNPADFVHLDSLILVAFVQDELSKAIYQAAYVNFKDILSTGIEHNLSGIDGLDYIIYPNPAESIVYLEFSNSLKQDLVLEIYNELGSRLERKILHKGSGRFSIDTYRYSRGIYFLKLSSGKNNYGTKRLVIIH